MHPGFVILGRMSTAVRALLVAALLTAVAVVVGVSVAGGGSSADPEVAPAPAAEPSSTPLASFDTSTVILDRASFCSRVDASALEDALGGEVVSSGGYDNGDRARVDQDVKDVAHEFACTWRGPGQVTVRAWLFAPPVTRVRARELASSAGDVKGCTPITDAPAFGRPSVGLVCGEGDARTASYRGLFGDAWLTCSLTAPNAVTRSDLVDRAGRWCVSVASAAAAPTAG